MPDFKLITDSHGVKHFYVNGTEIPGIIEAEISLHLNEIPTVKLTILANPTELTVDGANVTAQQMMELVQTKPEE